MSISAIIQFLVVLGIMVLVHEFGHYAAAKLLGIRVEVFSIGFGTRLFGFRKGDTDYRVCLLPLGGYVKMTGETPGQTAADPGDSNAHPNLRHMTLALGGANPATDPGDFNAHPRWHRMIVAFAGPIANFVLAFLLIMGLNMAHHEVDAYLSNPVTVDYVPLSSPFVSTGIQPGDTVVQYDTVQNPHFDDLFDRSQLNLNHTIAFDYLHNGQRVDTTVKLTTSSTPDNFDFYTFFVPRMQANPTQVADIDSPVTPGSPAALAGLRAGDKILAMNSYTPHSVIAMQYYLQDQQSKPEILTVERGNNIFHVAVVPQQTSGADGLKYRLGVSVALPPTNVEKLGFIAAAVESAKSNWKATGLIGDVLRGLFEHRVSIKAMSGPIGIGQQVHQAFQLGWDTVIQITAIISLNLGVFNLLPIPILDGGMILFLLIESIMRRDVNEQVKERIYQVAFVCIILFAAFVIFNDITKIYSPKL